MGKEKRKNLFTEKGQRTKLIVFVLAFVIAIGSISMGFVLSGNKEAGYHIVDVQPEYTVNTFASGITYHLYAEGSSNAIKRTLQSAGVAYSTALQRALFLLDADAPHEGYVNLHTLNAHPGETYTISRELYAVLADALAKTESGTVYSLFDGALFTLWQEIRYLDAPEEFDPANNPDTAELFSQLTIAVHAPGACTLTLIGGDTPTARLDISPEMQSLLAEYDLTGTVLNLNVMKEAYVVDFLAQEMEKAGYTDGYFTSQSGVSRVQNRSDTHYLLAETNSTVPAQPNSSCASLSVLAPSDNTPGYYAIEADGETLHRSAYIDYRTGAANLLVQSAAVARQKDACDVLFDALALLHSASAQQAEETHTRLIEQGAQAEYILSK